jgi:hypothetical protein
MSQIDHFFIYLGAGGMYLMGRIDHCFKYSGAGGKPSDGSA